MPKLGINIDHVATLRQARREFSPDPIAAAKICQQAGANSIVAHLREDRRHILDRDILALRRILKIKFNLEMSIEPEIVRIAARIKPDQATLVPEKREELTTEGGLDVIKNFDRIQRVVKRLKARKIIVNLFIDPDPRQIRKAKETGAQAIELHTGRYAHAKTKKAAASELRKIKAGVLLGRKIGLTVHAGHGLNYQNTRAVARIKGIEELNIGHSIIARAVFVGLKQAVREMRRLALMNHD
ncbi:MAG: pyridoxine 5'-phosphate synthase [Candidatus Omnitrophota bacterium]